LKTRAGRTLWQSGLQVDERTRASERDEPELLGMKQMCDTKSVSCPSKRLPALDAQRSFCSSPVSVVSGLLVVDKPAGMTSFDVVARVKRGLNLQKAGHCGTLDPFATGVLLICINRATRIADQLLFQDKTYRFVIRLGVETDTLDATGNVTRTHAGGPVSREALEAVLAGFRGKVLQRVPHFSAVKFNGDRLYKLARGGMKVDLPPREVEVHGLDLTRYAWPEATLAARCSKGTYIRQLAADIGSALGCGAHVRELRRISSGPFAIDQAASLDDVLGTPAASARAPGFIAVNEALGHLEGVKIEDPGVVKALHNGYLAPEWEEESRKHLHGREGPVRLVDGEYRLLALWWPCRESGDHRRLRVFGPQTW